MIFAKSSQCFLQGARRILLCQPFVGQTRIVWAHRELPRVESPYDSINSSKENGRIGKVRIAHCIERPKFNARVTPLGVRGNANRCAAVALAVDKVNRCLVTRNKATIRVG